MGLYVRDPSRRRDTGAGILSRGEAEGRGGDSGPVHGSEVKVGWKFGAEIRYWVGVQGRGGTGVGVEIQDRNGVRGRSGVGVWG